MRTAEERIKAMHSRAAEIKKEKDQRNAKILSSATVIAGLAAVILLGILMPGLTENLTISEGYGGYSASIFSESNAISFIVIGILSFILGVCVTVFCYRLRKLSTLNDKESEEDR